MDSRNRNPYFANELHKLLDKYGITHTWLDDCSSIVIEGLDEDIEQHLWVEDSRMVVMLVFDNGNESNFLYVERKD